MWLSLEIFRFDYEYHFNYECDYLAVELVMLTTSIPAILVINRRTAIRFSRTPILRNPVMNSVVPKNILAVTSEGLYFLQLYSGVRGSALKSVSPWNGWKGKKITFFFLRISNFWLRLNATFSTFPSPTSTNSQLRFIATTLAGKKAT